MEPSLSKTEAEAAVRPYRHTLARPRRALAQTLARVRGGSWSVLDAVAAAAAMLLAHRFSPLFTRDPLGPEALRAALAHAGAFVLLGHAVGLYDPGVLARRGLIVRRAVLAALLSPAATVAVFYLALYQPIGRWIVALAILFSAAMAAAPRLLLWQVVQRRPRRVLFVGRSALGARAAEELRAGGHAAWQVVAAPPDLEADDLPELCRTAGVDEIVLPLQADDMGRLLGAALRCLPLGCQVRFDADFYEETFRSIPVDQVAPEWLLGRGWDTSNHASELLKRTLDVALALALLVVTAPLLLLAMALIRLGDGGPALYTQVRLGRHGRTFRIIKLRSMRLDAELEAAQWAQANDPRRTLLGRLLRRTRLDELPQLVNILLGHMSFVGPRPERPEMAERLQAAIPYYSWRHLVRPGLTGWAQINHPYGGTLEDGRRKLELDLHYVRCRSLLLDLVVLLRTLTAALQGGR